MKEILRNKQGKIYDCTLNRANLNIFQLMWFIILPHMWGDLKRWPAEFFQNFINLGNTLLYLLLLPVLPFVRAIVYRDGAKKEIARHEARKAKRE